MIQFFLPYNTDDETVDRSSSDVPRNAYVMAVEHKKPTCHREFSTSNMHDSDHTRQDSGQGQGQGQQNGKAEQLQDISVYPPYTACAYAQSMTSSCSNLQLASSTPFASSPAGDTVRRRPEAAANSNKQITWQEDGGENTRTPGMCVRNNIQRDYGRVNKALESAVELDEHSDVTVGSQSTQV